MLQDGRISAEELLRVNFLNAWARRDMDTNGDGLLSRCCKVLLYPIEEGGLPKTP